MQAPTFFVPFVLGIVVFGTLSNLRLNVTPKRLRMTALRIAKTHAPPLRETDENLRAIAKAARKVHLSLAGILLALMASWPVVMPLVLFGLYDVAPGLPSLWLKLLTLVAMGLIVELTAYKLQNHLIRSELWRTAPATALSAQDAEENAEGHPLLPQGSAPTPVS
jgi:hypothetical protein